MNEEWGKPFRVRIVASDHSLVIDVFKVAFNAYTADIEGELKLPLTNTNLLKLLADEKLQSRQCWKRVHATRMPPPSGRKQCPLTTTYCRSRPAEAMPDPKNQPAANGAKCGRAGNAHLRTYVECVMLLL
jgi:hypothetical protein